MENIDLIETEQIFASIRPRYPELKGKVALVTGSSRGIGRGIALRLAREGMKIVLHGLDEAELHTTQDEFRQLGCDSISSCTDLGQSDGVDTLFSDVKAHYGTLDLLVNNAASLRRVDFEQNHTELLDYQLAVNIRAPYLCAWQAAEMMRGQTGGNIISMSSVGALQAHWRGLPYDATKGAIDAMTRAMALDLAADNIRVNAIAPGAILRGKTENPERLAKLATISKRIPLGRFGTALEIGSMVAFLASEDASYITGQIMVVDGGITAQISPPGQPI